MLLWCINFAIAKIGLEQLPPILFMASRFGLVALLLLPFAKRPTGQWGAVFAISITLGLLHFSFMFNGLKSIDAATRSEEHTSELQSLMRISYAVFCLKKKQITNTTPNTSQQLNITPIHYL